MEELLEKIKQGEIPSKAELEALDFESCQKATAELRRLHTNSEIIKNWKCTSTFLSSFFQTLQIAKIKGNILVGQTAIDHLNKIKTVRGLPKIGEEEGKVKRPYNRHVDISQSNNIDDKDVNNEVYDKNFTSTPPVQPIKEVEVNNALINIKRKFKTNEVSGLLERLSLFLSEDGQEFLVEIRITEVGNGSN